MKCYEKRYTPGLAFSKLEELELVCGGEGLVGIIEGLEEGGCMGLKHLNLRSSEIGVNAAMALTRVLSSGHCHNLQSLDCTRHAFEDKQNLLAFFQSIENLSLPASLCVRSVVYCLVT